VFEDEVFLAHGTPRSDKTYWLEEVHAFGHMIARSLDDVEEAAEGFDFPVLLCGHSHVQRLVMLSGGRLVINPGSVGCPAYTDNKPYKHNMSAGSPHARYAVLDRRDGVWIASFRAVPYDNMRASEQARANGRLDWAEGLATGWIR
jgi:diadenosine tetraphosphatase ApaH/serine/threonine PP2A family protein phosphatase